MKPKSLLIFILIHFSQATERWEQILMNLNKTVNPCDNFHDYVCGGTSNESLYERLQTEVWARMNQILTTQDTNIESFSRTKDFYKLCLESINTKSMVAQIRSLIKNLTWSIRNSNESYNWTHYLTELRQRGLNYGEFFNADLQLKVGNPYERIIKIKPKCSKSCKLLREPKKTDSYRRNLKLSSAYFGTPISQSDLSSVLKFESNLVKLYKQSSYDKTFDVTELQKLLPFIDWNDTFCGQNVTKIFVKNVRYFEGLSHLLSRMSNSTISHYILMQIILNLSPLVKMRCHLSQSRTNICLSFTRQFFPITLNAMYSRRFVSKSTKNAVLKLTANLVNQYKRKILKNSWIFGKSRALEKLTTMTYAVAYPDEFENDELLETLYQEYDLNYESFLQTLLNVRIEDRRNKMVRRELYDPYSWLECGDGLEVNARYDRLLNRIEIPVSLLQDSVFSLRNPPYLNYGLLGSIIGHEIAHSLDPTSIKNDKIGLTWWTSYVYKSKLNCLINKYDSFSNSLGNRTVNENFADINGLLVSYSLYRDQIQTQNYTARRLFWLSAGNLWCGKYVGSVNDKHAPNSWRINGPVSELQEFADDFQCSAGSSMNPVVKCDLL